MSDIIGCHKLARIVGCLSHSPDIICDMLTFRSPLELVYLDENDTRSHHIQRQFPKMTTPNENFTFSNEEQQYLLNKTEMETGCPVRLPYFLSPFILPNLAISMSYFNIGVAEYLLSAPIVYYLIKILSVDATHYSVFTTITIFPTSLRFLFGMIVDTLSFLGYRRKPWNMLGWLAYIILMVHLYTYSNPSLAALTIGLFGSTFCLLFISVCNDAQWVERANRFESNELKGSIQSSVHGIKSFGYVVGSLISGLVFNLYSWGWGLAISELFLFSALLPASLFIPFWWHSAELKSCIPIPSVYTTMVTIADTLALDAVRLPMVFIGFHSLLQVQNPSWNIFLVQGLDFNAFHLVLLTVCGSLGFFSGVVVFNKYLFMSSYRKLFVMTGIANFVFVVLQIALVERWNKRFGIPDIVVAMLDNALESFMGGISSMPISIFFLLLCPDGSEGIVYSALLTLQQTAAIISKDLGTVLTLIFTVDSESIRSGNFAQVLYLSLITSALQISPLLAISYMPNGRAEINQIRVKGKSNMASGLIIGILYSIAIILTVWFNFSLLWK